MTALADLRFTDSLCRASIALASTLWVFMALPLGLSLYLRAAMLNGPEVTVSDDIDEGDSCGGDNVDEDPHSDDPYRALAAVLGLDDGFGENKGEDSGIGEA
jgi:hypothetical protein